MNKPIISTLILIFILSFFAQSQVIHSWRGPNRDGVYHEQNLLKKWDTNGPQIIWANENLGKGFTSPVIVNDRIIITGLEGEMGYVYILSMQGELIKKYEYGKEVSASSGYPGTRSTPTIADNLLYIATGYGKLICMDISDGKIVWTKDLFNDFDGENIRWSLTENLIIDGDKLFVAPGGKKYNVVALNRLTGDLIWKTAGKGDVSAYCSPLLINHNGNKILITVMAKNILAINSETGNILWTYPYANFRNIHPNTPIYYNSSLYVFSGYGYGGLRLDLNEAGTEVSHVWTNETVDPKMGGAVLINGYLYASGDKNRRWFCIDWKTGNIKYESKDLDKGTVIYADEMLYIYSERGELALVEPNPNKFNVISKTEVKLGSEQHWAHLVINNGILYVRHGNALIAYNIKID